MTKREFKQKCKAQGAGSCKLSLSGTIAALAGAVVAVAALLFAKAFPVQIIGYVVGAVLAAVGIGLDLAGEILLSRAYQAYQQQNR
ncbi:MAG: hypothetical protein ACLRVT_04475 [Oscillospiraceae bacterium]